MADPAASGQCVDSIVYCVDSGSADSDCNYSLRGSPCHWSPRRLIGRVSDSDRVALVVVSCGLQYLPVGVAQHIAHSMWPCGGCDGVESLHMIPLGLNAQPLAGLDCCYSDCRRRHFCRQQTWTITLQLLCPAGSPARLPWLYG